MTEHYFAGARRKPTLSEEECVSHGGHCWERTGLTLTSNPPQYPEVCRHCPARRTAVPREPFEYYYPSRHEAGGLEPGDG